MASFSSALRWLYARNQFSIKLGLEATQALLGSLGNPEQGQIFLHVAGTNGKGSVCANLAAMLPALGWTQVGLYTSPHLVSFRERIRVNGLPIPADAVAAWMNASLPVLETHNPTYFECVTALAFDWFQRSGCDAVVLETGLGGRLDATNVVHPAVTVITSISLDHTAILGDTLQAIQSEKLGIVKPGVPVVIDEPRADLAGRAEAHARAQGAPFINLADRFEAGARPDGAGEEWRLRGLHGTYRLPGDLRSEAHQMRNAGLSVLALEAFYGKALPSGSDGAAPAWLTALRGARMAGRTQWIRPRRSSTGAALASVLLDGAHNAAGVEALCTLLRRAPSRARVFFSVMRDKDFIEVHRALEAVAAELVYLDMSDLYPRALPVSELRDALRAAGRQDAAEALRVAPLTRAGLEPLLQSPPDLAVFCGSLFLLGEVIPLLLSRYEGLEEFEALTGEKDLLQGT
jgi:dihydrofolate synthase/folylpolyglutamate synthase